MGTRTALLRLVHAALAVAVVEQTLALAVVLLLDLPSSPTPNTTFLYPKYDRGGYAPKSTPFRTRSFVTRIITSLLIVGAPHKPYHITAKKRLGASISLSSFSTTQPSLASIVSHGVVWTSGIALFTSSNTFYASRTSIALTRMRVRTVRMWFCALSTCLVSLVVMEVTVSRTMV